MHSQTRALEERVTITEARSSATAAKDIPDQHADFVSQLGIVKKIMYRSTHGKWGCQYQSGGGGGHTRKIPT